MPPAQVGVGQVCKSCADCVFARIFPLRCCWAVVVCGQCRPRPALPRAAVPGGGWAGLPPAGPRPAPATPPAAAAPSRGRWWWCWGPAVTACWPASRLQDMCGVVRVRSAGPARRRGRAGADNENERPCLVRCWGRGGPGRGAELQDWLRCPARPAARPTTDWAP